MVDEVDEVVVCVRRRDRSGTARGVLERGVVPAHSCCPCPGGERDAGQEPTHRGLFVRLEMAHEDLLGSSEGPAGAAEQGAPGVGRVHLTDTAVGRVRSAFDEPGGLERVDDVGHLGLVDAESVREQEL
ncbi:hypothetical protein [Curtobacterium sp. MCJR17_043]|uniref:hypothetical protein n=1 Tax=Curtobacterium sp. MCJR17_043 TaxID=2175660 RepID=UPI0032E92BAC